jgi:hypothetical protein
LTVDEMAASESGKVCQPPNNNNTTNPGVIETTTYLTPYWSIWQNLEDCVCEEGRFSSEYISNGIVCANETVYPPP